ncbi:Allergen V5/Tpx-1 family protein [Caballeronia udeis]|uniref:Allergen V5/Tpx-1 family protein n=1 Tax=Caballeronia udeis TaxID=1232866 RepID=A0A158EV58_9BURK|nr:CAP domain-containing protein [Caballeronia udeis]SAL11441.1 Allergen V5/Tpx-1 family protein [Caballeronia udeis]
MKSTIRRSAIAAATASVFLSACGGGGSSSTTGAAAPASGASAAPATPISGATPATPASGASSTPAASAAISLFAAPGAAVSDYAATGDIINDSLGFMNAKRAQLGLPPVAFQSAVAQAAANHSLYVQTNNAPGHYETAGTPGFTGATPTDRVNALYPTNSAGEIVAGQTGAFPTSVEPIDALFDAPFHRAIMVYDWVFAGPGAALTADPAKWSALTVDFADHKTVVPDDKLVAYPYPGQANAKASWLDIESPDPLAGSGQLYSGQTVGYPVTLSGAGNAAFSNIVFVITDPTGAAVPCQEVDNSNNAEATRLALCVPFKPLNPSTTYNVAVTGSLTNTSIPNPQAFAVSWSFTTQSASAATAKAATTGGSGNAAARRFLN